MGIEFVTGESIAEHHNLPLLGWDMWRRRRGCGRREDECKRFAANSYTVAVYAQAYPQNRLATVLPGVYGWALPTSELCQ